MVAAQGQPEIKLSKYFTLRTQSGQPPPLCQYQAWASFKFKKSVGFFSFSSYLLLLINYLLIIKKENLLNLFIELDIFFLL